MVVSGVDEGAGFLRGLGAEGLVGLIALVLADPCGVCALSVIVVVIVSASGVVVLWKLILMSRSLLVSGGSPLLSWPERRHSPSSL